MCAMVIQHFYVIYTFIRLNRDVNVEEIRTTFKCIIQT